MTGTSFIYCTNPMPSCFLFTLIALLVGDNSPSPIVIDGRFDDWRGVEPALIDPADARGEPVDLRELRFTSDGRFVHLLVDFGRTVNIQKLDVAVHLVLDVDGKESTGLDTFGLKGADLDIILSPTTPPDRAERPGGVQLVSTDTNAPPLNPYDIGFTFGPTYASRQFEFRIERGMELEGIPPVLAGSRMQGKIVCTDPQGNIIDQTAAFGSDLAPLGIAEQTAATELPAKSPGAGALRIVSWNAANGAVFDHPEPFVRVLSAIDPDVIFLQELTERNSAAQLESLLNRHLPSEVPSTWTVAFGAGGGNLRCAVASNLPLEPAEPFQLLPYPDWPDRSLRVAGAVIETANKRLLCVSVHLRCCGGIGSQQDFIRILEVETIREELRKLAESGTFDGVIVAGDFNLVGSRRPLDLLTTRLDITSLSLSEAEPYQLDSLSNATWSDREQSFVPGRLDYLLFSSRTVALRSTFVLDARDLTPQALRRLGLRSDDTAAASDHFPVVADVQWIPSKR